ncbi:MAG: hypothetical protein ACRELV_14890, partial [Longimicrobiales bacterium]
SRRDRSQTNGGRGPYRARRQAVVALYDPQCPSAATKLIESLCRDGAQSPDAQRPMTFEATVDALRELLGQTLTVNLTDERYGIADGYLADFHGILDRIDEPIAGVDSPVFYFRLSDSSGFSVHREMFRNATWQTIAGERSLRIELNGVVATITPEADTVETVLQSR